MASIVMSDMLIGVGLLNGSKIWSFEQMIKDCEIFGIIHKMMEGIAVNDETLALDAIRDVGPRGDFLTHDHTLKHMRNLWLPTLMDRRPYGLWEEKGDSASDWALEKAKEIMKTHHPEPLEPKLRAELEKIIKSVENQD
jgi:trimethylamine--corrinoid protein Co-methyltransferase